MAYSDVSASEWQVRDTRMMEVRATGGTRGERGAAIAAYVRKHPKRLERYHISYSETYAKYYVRGSK